LFSAVPAFDHAPALVWNRRKYCIGVSLSLNPLVLVRGWWSVNTTDQPNAERKYLRDEAQSRRLGRTGQSARQVVGSGS
jgi:hypothetical protein